MLPEIFWDIAAVEVTIKKNTSKALLMASRDKRI
jgi:hypothetical protein